MFPLTSRISASGLFAQQNHLEIISKNIANKDVEGYKRINPSFSTVQYNGGVSFSSSTNNYPWVDRNLAEKTADLARATSIDEGLSALDNFISTNNVEDAYNRFMSANKNLQSSPGSQQYLQEFNSTGKALNDFINQASYSLTDIQRTITNKINLGKVQLDGYKAQLDKITSSGINETNANDAQLLQQRISSLTASLAGYNEFSTKVIPSIASKFNTMSNNLKTNINTAIGGQAFVGETWVDQTAPNSYNVNNTNSILNFKDEMGAFKTLIGASAEQSQIEVGYFTNQREQAAKEYDKVYGVNLEQETLNMINAQRMYEANIKVLQTSDSMIGTLLNIMK